MRMDLDKEFRRLYPRLEEEAYKVLDERRELGLHVPEGYGLKITLYSLRGANAVSCGFEGESYITINLLNLLYDQFGNETKKQVRRLMKYFDFATEFLMSNEDSDVLELMNDPEKKINEIEALLFINPDAYMKCGRMGKKSYSKLKGYFMADSREMGELLAGLVPTIVRTFSRADLSCLRHEMDHVDFHSSPLYKNHMKRFAGMMGLARRFKESGEREDEKRYLRSVTSYLNSFIEAMPSFETRALFFNFINPGEWERADYDDVKRMVKSSVILRYAENIFTEQLLKTLMSREQARGVLDVQTANYLMATVKNHTKNSTALVHSFSEEEVDFDLAGRILYEEMPAWKLQMIANIGDATEAMGNAFRDNPRRFRRAGRARSFRGYLDICNGEKD